MREAIDTATPAIVLFVGELGRQAPFEPGDEIEEAGFEERAEGDLLVVMGEGDAPDLGAFLLVGVVEILLEAGDQIAFGEDHIDRQAHAEGAVQFADALAQNLRLMAALFLAGERHVGDADGKQNAVDRAAAAEFLQQIEKAAPGGRINALVDVLGGVAPGGVDQHRVVGDPPIAVAGTADALDSDLAFLGERELQA